MERTLPLYFFLNGKLHKRLKIVKTQDVVVAFCFIDEQTMHYRYSMTLKDFQKAYTLREAAALVKRPAKEIHGFMKRKLVDRPSGFSYRMNTKVPMNLYWSQDEIFELRDRLYELLPKGKDGYPLGNYRLASKAELREAINGDISYYVRTPDGEFKKVWRAI